MRGQGATVGVPLLYVVPHPIALAPIDNNGLFAPHWTTMAFYFSVTHAPEITLVFAFSFSLPFVKTLLLAFEEASVYNMSGQHLHFVVSFAFFPKKKKFLLVVTVLVETPVAILRVS